MEVESASGFVVTRRARTRLSITFLIVAAIGIAALSLWLRFWTPGGSTPGAAYPVTIAPGLTPSWTAEAAADAALKQIQSMEVRLGTKLAEPQIVSVEAASGASAPMGDTNLASYSIVWVVKANGTFVSDFGPPGRTFTGTYGWFLFDDAGLPIGSGFQS